jgi:hypothetical protein
MIILLLNKSQPSKVFHITWLFYHWTNPNRPKFSKSSWLFSHVTKQITVVVLFCIYTWLIYHRTNHSRRYFSVFNDWLFCHWTNHSRRYFSVFNDYFTTEKITVIVTFSYLYMINNFYHWTNHSRRYFSVFNDWLFCHWTNHSRRYFSVFNDYFTTEPIPVVVTFLYFRQTTNTSGQTWVPGLSAFVSTLPI